MFPVTIGGRRFTNEDFLGRRYYNAWPDLLQAVSLSGGDPHSFTLKQALHPYFGDVNLQLPQNLAITGGSRLYMVPADESPETNFIGVQLYTYDSTTGAATGYIDYRNARFRSSTAWRVVINPQTWADSGDSVFTNTSDRDWEEARAVMEFPNALSNYEHIENFLTMAGPNWTLSGTGAISAQSNGAVVGGTNYARGAMTLSNDTSQVGSLRFCKDQGFACNRVGTPIYCVQWLVNIPALSSAGQRYILRIGSARKDANVTDLFSTGGFGVEYVDNVNTGRWVVKYGNGTPTSVNTATAVTTGTHLIELAIGNGSFVFRLNGAAIYTNSVDTLSATAVDDPALHVPALSVAKTVGSTAILTHVRGFRVYYKH